MTRVLMKRILLRGEASGDERRYDDALITVIEAQDQLVRVQDDGVGILVERVGRTARWFPNWRVLEVRTVEGSDLDTRGYGHNPDTGPDPEALGLPPDPEPVVRREHD